MIEAIGYLGGFLIAISLLPQLIKTYKTKSAKDISLVWTAISLIGLILYGFYAAKNLVYPLLTFATIESVMIIILIGLKYDNKNIKKITSFYSSS
ncbi:MAG: PQ-loop domain-containing transporter [Candidatus Woesearchaeota archaeon]